MLIIPKNNSEDKIVINALAIYYKNIGFLKNKHYHEIWDTTPGLGVLSISDATRYSKTSELDAYFGFVEWEDFNNPKSMRRITPRGRLFYEHYISHNKEAMLEDIMQSVEELTFGRYNCGCYSSDSDIEPPAVYMRGILDLNYITNVEFAYLVYNMDRNLMQYEEIIEEILYKRSKDIQLELVSDAEKFKDPKPFLFMENRGIFISEQVDNQKRVKFSPLFYDKYVDRIRKLKLYNVDKVCTIKNKPNPVVSKFDFKNLPNSFKQIYSRRFITSLLAKPFVILTGNSGTGKTRIAKQFAEYNEILIDGQDKNWELVPVGADWTDNTKIMGFYNPLADGGKGNFVKTSILKLIENANMYKDIPFFLILDEMNLSHVERYFSDFLSHMETTGNPFVLDGYPNVLYYPRNLFVIGTVNIDETTYMFSPKVLDRANVIEFKPDADSVLDLFVNKVSEEKITPANNGTAEAFYQLSEFVKSINIDSSIDMDAVKKVYSIIYSKLDDSGFEFAFRSVNEIKLYINAAYELLKENDIFNINSIIDEQLVQKILPKIHGNRKEIGVLLDDLLKICSDDLGNVIYPISEKKLKQMKGKLDKIQYASFI